MNTNNIFAAFDTKDSYAILFIMLIAFLMGFLVAWLLRTAALRRRRKEAEEAAARQAQAEAQLTATQAELQERNRQLQEESREKVDLMDAAQRHEAEKTHLYQEINRLKAELERLQTAGRTYTTTIDELNEQIATLSIRQAAPQEAAAVPQAEEPPVTQPLIVPWPEDRLALLEQRIEVLALENQQLKDGLGALQEAKPTDDDHTMLVRLEERLSQLAAENELLQQKLANLPADLPSSTAALTMAAIPLSIAEPEAEFAPNRAVNDAPPPAEIIENTERDDLTRIEGIGPFLESQLNQIGVFTYADIADWDAARVAAVTEAIGYFPGRIDKDNWVGQAQQLIQKTSEEPADAADAPLPTEADVESAPLPAAPPAEDDLTLIEGIGPKIAELLNDAGIRSWNELAHTDPGLLRELLNNAGDAFRMHTPYTWPLQARLAAAGRWDELNEYQKELRGGRDENP